MSETTDPGRVEVVEFMRRNGGSASAAARFYFPKLTGKALERLTAKYRTWWSRHGDPEVSQARQASNRPPPAPPAAPVSAHTSRQGVQAPPPPAAPPEATVDLSALSPIDRLTWQLGQLSQLHQDAMRRRDHRSVATLDSRIAALGQQLDEARRSEGQVTKLDRVPAAVALAMKKRQRAIDILAAAGERMAADTTPGAGPAEEP